MIISENDINDLKIAKSFLESSGLAAKMVHTFGISVEKGLEYLPERWEKRIVSLSESALKSAIEIAIYTLKTNASEINNHSSDTFHKLCVAASGGVGGAFGFSTLAVELPITTTLMLRSIADIARSEGENLDDIEPRLACLEVFALGNNKKDEDASETSYYVVRAALSNAIINASRYIAQTSIIDDSAPILLKFISTIASRFGVVVSEKMAATALPIIGAAGGALINTLFMDHFQDMARGHFTVRRLERAYGLDVVREAYELL
jgi:hypothetical protein